MDKGAQLKMIWILIVLFLQIFYNFFETWLLSTGQLLLVMIYSTNVHYILQHFYYYSRLE